MNILDAYLWLSNHFPKYFVEVELCVELRSKIQLMIQKTINSTTGRFKLFEEEDPVFDDVIYQHESVTQDGHSGSDDIEEEVQPRATAEVEIQLTQ